MSTPTFPIDGAIRRAKLALIDHLERSNYVKLSDTWRKGVSSEYGRAILCDARMSHYVDGFYVPDEGTYDWIVATKYGVSHARPQ